ncbi:hypothetical protein MAR_002523 [Mya arenaria]|uniref:Uncharacterized protein n=1 Tax=Mya arenaria TaxID=6604 RepID=A0ABY7G3E4_MYAAR|nr:hypothetical protein MAR_002523 [Mya arenaria]
MILKLTEEHSLTNLKDKCEDGSIGDVLIDLLQRKDVRERLIRGTYDFKMKLHATTEDAPYVEMKIEGTIFDKKERMCKHRTEKDSTAYSSTNLSREHPRHICEELEISDHLLDILHEKNLVPLDIARKLRVKVNRRDKIHELLRHYNACKEKGFSTLSKYIQMERELRGKKAYPLKLFEGKFRTKYGFQSSEKPKHQNSPSEKMFAQLRRRIKSKKHKETRSSSSTYTLFHELTYQGLTSRRVSDTSRSGISIKMADDESSSAVLTLIR